MTECQAPDYGLMAHVFTGEDVLELHTVFSLSDLTHFEGIIGVEDHQNVFQVLELLDVEY